MIFLMFFLIPLAVGALAEYVLCRFPKKRFWRYLPPAAAVLAVGLVAWSRWNGWNAGSGGAPVETLLFFPGLPGTGLLTGTALGWRVWKRLWSPRVVRKKKE